MKAAVAYEDGEVFQHFGETPAFRIYEAEGYDIVSAETVDCDGRSHMELVDLLKDLKVDALICGGICEEPWTELTRSGIKVCSGVILEADLAADAFFKRALVYNKMFTEGSCQGCCHHCH